jgi:hypothetical protein
MCRGGLQVRLGSVRAPERLCKDAQLVGGGAVTVLGHRLKLDRYAVLPRGGFVCQTPESFIAGARRMLDRAGGFAADRSLSFTDRRTQRARPTAPRPA